jgi:hypothetical protein
MVRLHLLGFTHDLTGVVFSQRKNGKTASFWVPIDDAFMGAVNKLERARRDRNRSERGSRGKSRAVVELRELPPSTRSRALPPVGRSEPRSGMPAAEIQQMLREGKSIKTVAKTAKTNLAWIERLAEPVLTERMGVVRLAQRAYMNRARLGQSGLQLGDAVERNLEERRVATDNLDLDAAWDARQMASGEWRVWVRFSHRGRRQVAQWDFKKSSRTIYPHNRLAAQIGWWAPELPPEPEPVEGEESEVDVAIEESKKPAPPPRRPVQRRKPVQRKPVQRKKPTPRKRKPAPKRRATAKRRPQAKKKSPARRSRGRR